MENFEFVDAAPRPLMTNFRMQKKDFFPPRRKGAKFSEVPFLSFAPSAFAGDIRVLVVKLCASNQRQRPMLLRGLTDRLRLHYFPKVEDL
jgi:hypothetical protein